MRHQPTDDFFVFEDETAPAPDPTPPVQPQPPIDWGPEPPELDPEIYGVWGEPSDGNRPLMPEEDWALLDRECAPTVRVPPQAPPHRAPWPLYDVRALMERPSSPYRAGHGTRRSITSAPAGVGGCARSRRLGTA
ncbi:hypothetical protein J2X36_004557 [Methylobacterium sp. BE186]|nr:hypothetical protein [Methylobacterium sp. BE186]